MSEALDLGPIEDYVSPVRRRHYQGKGHRKSALRAWDAKEFIAWDGEGISFDEPITFEVNGMKLGYQFDDGTFKHGLEYTHVPEPQPYVLLAHSKPNKGKAGAIRDDSGKGLSTRDCLEFILDAKKRYPDSIFVGFGFNYDINMILKDLPTHCLNEVRTTGTTLTGGYFIKWVPRKMFNVTHRRSGRAFILYDVFGYFAKSFEQVCVQFLGEEDPRLATIRAGKAARGTALFNLDEMDSRIIPYNAMELEMLVEIMVLLRKDLHDVSIDPEGWHGPGAVASKALAYFSVPISRQTPIGVIHAAQYGYAGGWFEHFWLGCSPGRVWEYDLHSAYPAATLQLPDLSKGHWEYVDHFEPGTFGVWDIRYSGHHGGRGSNHRPQPLYCRSENGSITHPFEVQGWYWTPEASLVPDSVRGGWVFRPSSDARPFAFIQDLYDSRLVLKGPPYNPAERALKLVLNSIYGKLAQTVGWDKKNKLPPTWHQFEWAGYITSYTRAKIYQAILQAPEAIIAVETDAIFSTVPLDLPQSDLLGDWECKMHEKITYLQSGFYYAEEPNGSITCRYRGMDRDPVTKQPMGLPYDEVLSHLATRTGRPTKESGKLRAQTTRFIGLGLGMMTDSVWRSWEKKDHYISLDGDRYTTKRYHDPQVCPMCQGSIPMSEALHPTYIGGYPTFNGGDNISWARSLPWSKRPVDQWWTRSQSEEEFREMDPSMRDFGQEADEWQ